MSRARESIGKLYASASSVVLDRYRDEVAIELCRTADADVLADPAMHRCLLKRLMHSLGLGLRHAYLLLERLEDPSDRDLVIKALIHGKRSSYIRL